MTAGLGGLMAGGGGGATRAFGAAATFGGGGGAAFGAAGATTRGLGGALRAILRFAGAARFLVLEGGFNLTEPIDMGCGDDCGLDNGAKRDRAGCRAFGIRSERTDGCSNCGTVGVVPS